MQKVAPDFTIPHSEIVLGTPLGEERPARFGGVFARFIAACERSTDAQLALLISAVLFALAAWPLALVTVPPLQDLPNHLAAATILQHPNLYPELVFNGYLKTNSALFTWLVVGGKFIGLRGAARLFVLVVLALGALALPQFVLAFGGRRRMVLSGFFVWPVVHNWFVSMGMLDFALSVPLATFLLVALERQLRRPSVESAIGIGGLALLTWHAHVFPLLVVDMLVALQVVLGSTWEERRRRARILGPPLLPAALLVVRSLWAHVTEPVGPTTGYVALDRLLPPWELFYNIWAEWFHAFTWLEFATLVPCLGLGLWAIYKWRDDIPFFGPVAFLALAGFYFFIPYTVTNWFHVNSRFIPFLCLAALPRLPERLPASWERRVLGVLGCGAITYSAGMACDYVRLDRDWSRFTAGMSVVPEGARLLPLVFRSKGTSENTRSLLHAWGFYTLERHTSAPLLFAHSRSFPLMYRTPPEAQFNHLVLESWAPSMASPDWACSVLRSGGVAVDDCNAQWQARWFEFWHRAGGEFDWVLLWSAPPAVMALVPTDYRVAFRRDELTILERLETTVSAPPD